MNFRRIALSLILAGLLPTSALAAGSWWKIEGTIIKQNISGVPTKPHLSTTVWLCTDARGPNIAPCLPTTTDQAGKYVFSSVSVADSARSFYLFADSPTNLDGPWGSKTVYLDSFGACEYVTVPWGVCTVTGIKSITSYGSWMSPRPNVPVTLSPAMNAIIPTTNVTLMWTDGLDVYRKSPSWPVTYDIWVSQNYGQESLSGRDLTCNRTDGKCSTLVAGPLPAGTVFTWRVVAKLWFDVNRTKNYSTSSIKYYVTTQGPSPTANFAFRSYYGQYVSATNGGGSDVTATAWGIGSSETFSIVDINGGELRSGDQINIVASNGMYLVAEGGGGGVVNANRTTAGPWETFTVELVGGSWGQVIGAGDGIAFSSYYGTYIVAEGGGGREVLCNRYGAGAWETFTLAEVW